MRKGTHQATLSREFEIKGVGLHTGRKCRAIFRPAPANAGFKFIRTDLPGNPVFYPKVGHVVDVVRGTTLGNGDHRVFTIEHILSSLVGCGVDNAVIELDDNEPPVADGSAKDFVDGILAAGVSEQSEERERFRPTEPFEYVANQTVVRVEPNDRFEILCEIGYDHPLLKNQSFFFTEDDDYRKEIAPARTYCFDYEIEALKKKGLAKGGSLDNAIVVGPGGIYNPGSFLRFPDEFVRHKVLDLMGDLSLLGCPLQARVIAKRCGHGHNINFLRKLMDRFPGAVPASVA